MIALLLAVILLCVAPAATARTRSNDAMLQGTVVSGGHGLAGYQVSLYGSFIQSGPPWMLLGSGTTDSSGNFTINYTVDSSWNQDQPVLFVEATHGAAMLASVIGIGLDAPASVVVNELTTVATANAFAQFVGSASIQGNFYGMKNAVSMAANLADPITGNVGVVLSSTPNGAETSTYATFNSLTNVVASCVAADANCAALITAATPAGQPAPANVLQALANVVNYPAYPGYPDNSQDPIYVLSQVDPVYQPALGHRPTNWLLFLKITGGFYSQQNSDNLMNGPGAFAVDAQGYVWADNNYIPEPPGHFACAGTRVLKFAPSGASAPGSPYFGGGISGSGWGVFVDTGNNVWVSNFGFQDPPCQFLPNRAPHNSISEFSSVGEPISPSQGFTDGNLSWPMGAALDRLGNIWIANCGNDTVTRYAGGDHTLASSIALGASVSPNNPQIKPFGVAVDLADNIWITNNRSSTVTILSPDGRVIKTIPSVYQGKTIITHPIGNAPDIEGNMWVANSDYLDSPCPTKNMRGPAMNPSITMFQLGTQEPYPGSPFTGGGVILPWGLLVDGKDTVWVFNFGFATIEHERPTPTSTSISRFCGYNTTKCPASLHTGDPISPSTGYRSDAFVRITGGAVDPSGNIWMTGNWKLDANPFLNPGSNSIVIAIGAAGPVQTPVIGPPVPFQ
jgi:hypothetical protein